MKTFDGRGNCLAVVVALGVLLASGANAAADPPASGVERFYIGTYSGAIQVSSLDLGAATLAKPTRAVSTGDPSFVALTPDRRFLYAVNEGGNGVVAFSVNPTNGTLTLLNQVSSNGGAPAHLVVDRSGKYVLVANYNGGNVMVYPILETGKLGATTARIQHPGTGPHPHCITLDAANHFAFVPDKGLDQVRCYIFDPGAGTLVTNTTLITAAPKGSGPRHMAFEPTYKRAYVICELSSVVIGYNFDSVNGTLTAFQTNSTLPRTGINGNTTAEIVVHPTGRYVYGSNRGFNTVVVYSVNPDDGTLTQIQQQTTGATPRNFAIDPTGAYCIVAGQDSGDVRLYSINPEDGKLTDTLKKITVAAPVCILPFLLTPPQPLLALSPKTSTEFDLGVGNSLSLLTYQLYSTADPGLGTWNLLRTGDPGQTNFTVNIGGSREFYRVGVLTNY